MNNSQSKFRTIETFLKKIESKLRFSTYVNLFVYSFIAFLFVAYAVFVPKLVAETFSDENGPKVLTEVVDKYRPTNQEIVQQLSQQIPKVINMGLDKVESFLPSLEEKIVSEFDKVTDQSIAKIRVEAEPWIREAIAQDLPKIKEMVEQIKQGESVDRFSSYISQEFVKHAQEHSKHLSTHLDELQRRLDSYKREDSQLTKKELSEKKLLLSFLRLQDDPAFHDAVKDKLKPESLQND